MYEMSMIFYTINDFFLYTILAISVTKKIHSVLVKWAPSPFFAVLGRCEWTLT